MSTSSSSPIAASTTPHFAALSRAHHFLSNMASSISIRTEIPVLSSSYMSLVENASQFIQSQEQELLCSFQHSKLCYQVYCGDKAVRQEEEQEYQQFISKGASASRSAIEAVIVYREEKAQRAQIHVAYHGFVEFATGNEPLWKDQARLRGLLQEIFEDAQQEKYAKLEEGKDFLMALQMQEQGDREDLSERLKRVRSLAVNRASNRSNNSNWGTALSKKDSPPPSATLTDVVRGTPSSTSYKPPPSYLAKPLYGNNAV